MMEVSYRESFGLALPPSGTEVKIEYLSGLYYYIVWPDCPDGENVLYSWIVSKKTAYKILENHEWILKN